MPFKDARPNRQSRQFPCHRRAVPCQNQTDLPRQRRSHGIGQHHSVTPRRQRAHIDGHGQRSCGIRAEELRIRGRSLLACVEQVEVPQLELTALQQWRRLFHGGADSLPLRRFLRQQQGL